jgi:hypothetical protein
MLSCYFVKSIAYLQRTLLRTLLKWLKWGLHVHATVSTHLFFTGEQMSQKRWVHFGMSHESRKKKMSNGMVRLLLPIDRSIYMSIPGTCPPVYAKKGSCTLLPKWPLQLVRSWDISQGPGAIQTSSCSCMHTPRTKETSEYLLIMHAYARKNNESYFSEHL